MSEQAGAPAAAPTTTQSSGTEQQNGTQTGGQSQQVKSDPQPKAQPKAWKAKVDGQEVAWEKEEDLVRDASLGKAAYRRMEEAAKVRKEAESFWEAFKKDPMQALENPALNISDDKRRELIEKYYQKKWLETDNLSPEQKELRELKAWKQQQEDAAKTKAEQEKQEAETKQRTELETKWRDTYQKQIIEVLEKGGFPKTPRTAARVAYYMAHAAQAGFDAPLETIVAQVGKDYEEELQAIMSDDVPMEAILKVLPKSILKRLRKYDIDQYKAKQAQPPIAKNEPDRGPRGKKEERMSYADVLKKLGS